MGMAQPSFGYQGTATGQYGLAQTQGYGNVVILQNTYFHRNDPVYEVATFPVPRGVVGKPWHAVVRPAPPVSLALSTAPLPRHAPVRAVLPRRMPRSRQAATRRRRPVRSRPGAKRAA